MLRLPFSGEPPRHSRRFQAARYSCGVRDNVNIDWRRIARTTATCIHRARKFYTSSKIADERHSRLLIINRSNQLRQLFADYCARW
jgi:hypothetical protein